MKAFAKILAAGFALFMVLAMIEEKEAFQPLVDALLSDRAGPAAAPALSEEEHRAAIAAVRELLALTAHLHKSGGDPRFAERLPASAEVVEEILAEVEYVRRNHRRQEMELMQLEVLEVQPVGSGLRLRTREFWIVSTFWVHGGKPASRRASTVTQVEYLLTSDAGRWQVAAWTHADPGTAKPDTAKSETAP